MTSFFGLFLGVWVVAIFVWIFVSRAFRRADLDRLKDRVAGGPKPETKKKKKTRGELSLLETEDVNTGKLVRRILDRFKVHARFQQTLEQAGLKWGVARLVHASIGCFIGGYLLAKVALPDEFLWLAMTVGCVFSALPLFVVARKKAARLKKFEEIFPDCLEFLARSMRAGHAFAVALEMIHTEFGEPLAGEFRRTFEEHNLGLPLDVALESLCKRVPLLDVQFFVSAVTLQKKTGGNLAEILDKLAFIIRERFKMRGKIKAISAHGKMTGTALSLIPCGVGALMFIVNPSYVEFFFKDETGQIMLGVSIALQITGYGIMMKIVDIEV
ncbi:MAG: type II secretion system F family protein [Acidobacteria bacterium]|nr:type II secretion system F family protein [Acidobacteriota bacterium]